MATVAQPITTDKIVGRQTDLSEDLVLLSPNMTPLLANLARLSKSRTANSTTVEWVDYTTRGTHTVLTGAINDSVTSVPVADATVFKSGEYIAVGDEVMKISSISGNNLTVTRGQLSTTAAAAVKDDMVIYINDDRPEGSDYQDGTYRQGQNYSNYTQIFIEEIKVSGTELSLNIPSGSGLNSYDLEQQRKFDVIAGRLEKSLMYGKKFKTGDKRGMDGILRFLDSGQIVDAGDAEVSMSLLYQILFKIYAVGGQLQNGYYGLMMHPNQKNKIDTLLNDFIKNAQPLETNMLGGVVDFIRTQFGTLPILTSINCQPNEIDVVNFYEISFENLPGRQFAHTYMGKDGDAEKGQIVGEYTVRVRNIHTHGKIKNLKK